ncbi:MAG: hypothetical protein NT126_12685 [Bacteroidetes bacterium]|nr:hypothetical protein [Bacteroidota bacterium]
MNLRLTRNLLIIAFAFALKATAQETESPMDTLTRRVASIQSTLDVISRIKISGYIQSQFQLTDSAGTASFAGGNFGSGADKRFMLRRGRVKVQYDSPNNDLGWSTSQYVFQIDVSEKGATIKDLYAKFTDPWSGWFSMTAGMQNRPFGYEIGYSSSLRESPERGRMSQTIFPNERDLGAMVTIQGPKISNWNWLKLEAGMFNGTGGPGAGANTSDFDKFKDFIAHLSMTRSNKTEKVKYGLGVSYCDGGFRQDQSNLYKSGIDSAGVKGFVIDINKTTIHPDIAARTEVKRNYLGVDGQVSIDWMAGITTIRAEYIQGTQPGTSGSSVSPASAPTDAASTAYTSTSTSNSTSVTTIDSLGNPHTSTTTSTTTTTKATTTTAASDLYKRKFNGAYFYFIQSIGQTPWQVLVKYDWYDPNTDVQGDDIGKAVKAGTKALNATDLKYSTLGLGLAYRWDANVKLTAYYDMVKNETSKNLAGYNSDLKDNVFTLRAQIKF